MIVGIQYSTGPDERIPFEWRMVGSWITTLGFVTLVTSLPVPPRCITINRPPPWTTREFPFSTGTPTLAYTSTRSSRKLDHEFNPTRSSAGDTSTNQSMHCVPGILPLGLDMQHYTKITRNGYELTNLCCPWRIWCVDRGRSGWLNQRDARLEIVNNCTPGTN